VARLQGVADRNLLYLCNLRNLWLNPFRFLGLGEVAAMLRIAVALQEQKAGLTGADWWGLISEPAVPRRQTRKANTLFSAVSSEI